MSSQPIDPAKPENVLDTPPVYTGQVNLVLPPTFFENLVPSPETDADELLVETVEVPAEEVDLTDIVPGPSLADIQADIDKLESTEDPASAETAVDEPALPAAPQTAEAEEEQGVGEDGETPDE